MMTILVPEDFLLPMPSPGRDSVLDDWESSDEEEVSDVAAVFEAGLEGLDGPGIEACVGVVGVVGVSANTLRGFKELARFLKSVKFERKDGMAEARLPSCCG
jgi:hypothetical protein